MFRKSLPGLAPVVAVTALAAMPVVTQAAVPRWFVNGVKASTKHEPGFSMGPVTLHNGILINLACNWFTGDSFWNEVKEGTERGFSETTGYATWECVSNSPVKIKNTKGETVEDGTFLTAEGPPETKTEKAHKTGSTSLPWTGELTEKEGGKFLLTTHHLKVWIVIPLCTEMGGTGVGPGCDIQGNEIPLEDDPAVAGAELAFKCVNGTKNGLTPFKAVLEGEKAEKNGLPETGRLESGFGAWFPKGSLVTAGSNAFELITCK